MDTPLWVQHSQARSEPGREPLGRDAWELDQAPGLLRISYDRGLLEI